MGHEGIKGVGEEFLGSSLENYFYEIKTDLNKRSLDATIEAITIIIIIISKAAEHIFLSSFLVVYEPIGFIFIAAIAFGFSSTFPSAASCRLCCSQFLLLSCFSLFFFLLTLDLVKVYI